MKLAASTHKIIKPVAGLVTAATAITTTLNVASSKNGSSGSWGYSTKAGYALARIIGGQAVAQLSGTSGLIPYFGPGGALNGVQAGINITGPFNTNTFGGIGVLVADHVVKMFKVPYYGTYASPFIKALGLGLLVGGVVGGLLDPDPSQITNPAPVNYPAITSTSPPVQMGMTQTASGGLQF